MDKIWDEISGDSKTQLYARYKELKSNLKDISAQDTNYFIVCAKIQELENIFDKNNLIPEPKTWKDFVEAHKEKTGRDLQEYIEYMYPYTNNNKYYDYIVAVHKIALMQEYLYNGPCCIDDLYNGDHLVWNIRFTQYYNSDTLRYCRRPAIISSNTEVDFLSFKTEELAKEFLEYNKDLVNQYFSLVQ